LDGGIGESRELIVTVGLISTDAFAFFRRVHRKNNSFEKTVGAASSRDTLLYVISSNARNLLFAIPNKQARDRLRVIATSLISLTFFIG
jgi:hypothetical protein